MARLFRFKIGGHYSVGFNTVEQYKLAAELESSLSSIGMIDDSLSIKFKNIKYSIAYKTIQNY